MKINKLKLKNFRNYRELNLSFNKNINIFIGNNAQGKTSLLEGIYYLAISKSHKTHKDKDLIKFNESFASISANLLKNDSHIDLEVIISLNGKKVSVNGVEKKKLSEYIGNFNVVMFAPEDLEIVKGEPLNRRKFLDIEIGQISSIYIYDLNQYNKILKQRNEYLKQVSTNKDIDYNYLDILTEQLASYCVKIIKKRLFFIERLNKHANRIHQYISANKEMLSIKYLSSFNVDISDITYERILDLYKDNYQADLYRGTTQQGIHRDDIRFFVNEIDISIFGSQGQQRTTALSLKLSLIDFIFEETNNYPVLLLDDVLSELDDNRQTQLLDCIQDKVQTFITTTNISGIKQALLSKSDIFHICDAQIL